MGVHPNVNPVAGRFPRQGTYLNARVTVCFNYDTSNTVTGTVVRDDAEEPGRMIIAIDGGPFVLSTECQYSLPVTASQSGAPTR